MTIDLGALTLVLTIAMVPARAAMLGRRGIAVLKFGATDRGDFFIAPFALFYVYLIAGAALHWPAVVHGALFDSSAASWIGVALCLCALVLMIVTLISFGTSFRVGIDTERPDKLVTSGVFAFTRNPIYVAFTALLAGEFLIMPNWILLLYFALGVALLHRQVLREEAYLRVHYGEEYRRYSERVPRYVVKY